MDVKSAGHPAQWTYFTIIQFIFDLLTHT